MIGQYITGTSPLHFLPASKEEWNGAKRMEPFKLSLSSEDVLQTDNWAAFVIKSLINGYPSPKVCKRKQNDCPVRLLIPRSWIPVQISPRLLSNVWSQYLWPFHFYQIYHLLLTVTIQNRLITFENRGIDRPLSDLSDFVGEIVVRTFSHWKKEINILVALTCLVYVYLSPCEAWGLSVHLFIIQNVEGSPSNFGYLG